MQPFHPILAAALFSATLLAAPQPSAQQSPAPPPTRSANVPPRNPPPLIHVAESVMSTLLLTRVDPAYPFAASVEGTLTLHVLVRKDGTVEHAAALSGPEPLREAAETAVRQWIYRPFLLNGEPVAVDTTVTLDVRRPPPSN